MKQTLAEDVTRISDQCCEFRGKSEALTTVGPDHKATHDHHLEGTAEFGQAHQTPSDEGEHVVNEHGFPPRKKKSTFVNFQSCFFFLLLNTFLIWIEDLNTLFVLRLYTVNFCFHSRYTFLTKLNERQKISNMLFLKTTHWQRCIDRGV